MNFPLGKRNNADSQSAPLDARRQSLDCYFVVICLSIGLPMMAAQWQQLDGQPAFQQAEISPSPVDINTADWTSFSQLEGIGPTLGFRIVADRERFGAFPSIDDLLRVEGIGPLTLDRIRYRLTIGHDQLKPSKRQRTAKQSLQ